MATPAQEGERHEPSAVLVGATNIGRTLAPHITARFHTGLTADCNELKMKENTSKTAPTAIEYMSRDTILYSENYLGKRFPDDKYDAYLLLTFDGNDPAEVEAQYGCVAELCLALGAIDVYIVDTDERKKSV